tara:strand:- start:16742 stop:16957 length:216 start_codon:yes stop_codon:yes gene_type:complete
MNFINKQLNKIKAFKKGKRVTISIPFKDLPKQTRDENEFNGIYMIMNSKSKHKHTPKPFVKVQVTNINQLY